MLVSFKVMLHQSQAYKNTLNIVHFQMLRFLTFVSTYTEKNYL